MTVNRDGRSKLKRAAESALVFTADHRLCLWVKEFEIARIASLPSASNGLDARGSDGHHAFGLQVAMGWGGRTSARNICKSRREIETAAEMSAAVHLRSLT